MSTLFSFPSKDQLNAQGAVTENPGSTSSLNNNIYSHVSNHYMNTVVSIGL